MQTFKIIIPDESKNIALIHSRYILTDQCIQAFRSTTGVESVSPGRYRIRESLLHSTAWNAGRADAAKALRASAVAQ